jgi:hypothetical protein
MNELTTYQDESAISSVAMLSDDALMNRVVKFAEIMATGKATIPAELRNVGDCLAITMQAMNWKMNPFSVAQKTFFIGGKIGYEAQLVAAAINNSGAVSGTFHFEWYGPWEKVIGKFAIKKGDKGEYRVPDWALADEAGIGIKCWATLKGETEPRVLDLLLAQARTRNSTLWADDPRQQLAYLAQKRWARLYAPGVILGVYTADELDQPFEREINPTGNAPTAKTTTAPIYSQEDFDKNLPAWKRLIADGKKTPEQIIAMVNTKATLTDEQKTIIKNTSSASAERSSAQASNGGGGAAPQNPGVTYAQVEAQLMQAKDVDLLDAAADLIGELRIEGERRDLTEIYRNRRAELSQ